MIYPGEVVERIHLVIQPITPVVGLYPNSCIIVSGKVIMDIAKMIGITPAIKTLIGI